MAAARPVTVSGTDDRGDGIGIDGLVGLDFLRELNIEIRPAEGRLLVDCAGTT